MATPSTPVDLNPKNGHKHSMKISGTHLFRDKQVTQLNCSGCYQYILVAHGWFQESKDVAWPRKSI